MGFGVGVEDVWFGQVDCGYCVCVLLWKVSVYGSVIVVVLVCIK